MLPYWIENENRVWFKIESLAPNATNVYHLRKTSGYYPNGSDVFDFFDDFDTLDTNVWNTWGSTLTISNGILHLGTTEDSQEIDSYQTFGSNTIIESRMFYSGSSSGTLAYYDINADKGACEYIIIYNQNDRYYAFDDVDSKTIISSQSSLGTTYNVYSIIFKQNEILYYVNGAYKNHITDINPKVKMGAELNSGNNTTGTFDIDWVRVRKYASTEPTVTVIDCGTFYKVVVKNNLSQRLRNYQVGFLGAIINGVAFDTSLEIIPIMVQDSIPRFNLFDNCKYYLKFDNGVSDVMNVVANTIDGATLANNRFNCLNSAYSFDGNDKITITTTDAVSLAGDFCIFGVIHDLVTTSANRIICENRDPANNNIGYELGIDNDNKPYFTLKNATTTYNCVSDDAYTGTLYIAGQRTGSQQDLYINGLLCKSITTTTDNLTNGATTLIGVDYSGSSLWFKGVIDTIIVFDRGLTQSEHNELYRLFNQKNVYPNGVPDSEQQRGS